jgi:hypothetical protein
MAALAGNYMHRRAVPAGFKELPSMPGGYQYECREKQGGVHRRVSQNTSCGTLLSPVCRLIFIWLCALFGFIFKTRVSIQDLAPWAFQLPVPAAASRFANGDGGAISLLQLYAAPWG